MVLFSNNIGSWHLDFNSEKKQKKTLRLKNGLIK
jgi:hypothetical protein